jgi:hypothetical protein
MLFSKVDSLTPLDKIPVEGRQEFLVKLKIKLMRYRSSEI